MADEKPHWTFHLGDVYYAGSALDCATNFCGQAPANPHQVSLVVVPLNLAECDCQTALKQLSLLEIFGVICVAHTGADGVSRLAPLSVFLCCGVLLYHSCCVWFRLASVGRKVLWAVGL